MLLNERGLSNESIITYIFIGIRKNTIYILSPFLVNIELSEFIVRKG